MPLSRETVALRTGAEAAPPPVRIIHLGLGHFFRAHQAWYTAHAVDAQDWGIAAFTGRSTAAVEVLSRQQGLFTVVERGPGEDRVEIVGSVAEAVAGTDIARLRELASDPAVAVITLTVTESGYRLTPAGCPDLDDADLTADLEDFISGRVGARTVLGRLVTALDARRRAGAGPIAVVSCDNIPDNGRFVSGGVVDFARRADASLAEWIGEHVSFVSTSVDRITPHVQGVPDAVIEAGWIDELPVVTEPFADWVLAGDFPAGRPAWETAGARFVDDIEPWENRKLWLLNGAHSILTFAGQLRGHETVADATADPECRALVDAFWAEAVQCLPAGTEHTRYREQLIDRFSNPRIVHRLAQIAPESSTKVEFRFAAVAERSVGAGRSAAATAHAIAVWIDWLRSRPGAPDARAAEVAAALAAPDPVAALVRMVSPTLADDSGFLSSVRAHRTSPTALPAPTSAR
ncbi:mannitol dehydrogenase family protein [Microbacterium hominis]|uniref:Mannitol-1-phosphate 5-dehydrogenase n=1 Tax=Microbacterium hominis TaxID=162426 RepID=A0A7D4PPL2_9MICO|nr:mannitol dehydrogenase family protein [Microbacterium hominis]